MPIDSSLAMQLRGIEMPSPMETASKVMTLRNLLNQGNMQELQMQEAKRKAALEQQGRAELSALGPNPSQESLAGLAAKYSPFKDVLTSQQKSLDRKELAKQRAMDFAQNLQLRQDALDQKREEFMTKTEDQRTRAMFEQWYKTESMKNQQTWKAMEQSFRQQGIDLRRDMMAQGNKSPAGYRWAQDGTLEAIKGGPADKGLIKPEDAAGVVATEGQKLLDIIKNDPRSAASILSGPARGIEAMHGLADETYVGPGMQAQAAKQRLLFAVDQLVKSGKSSNEFLRRLENALGMQGVTSPGNAEAAINEAIALTRSLGGGAAVPSHDRRKPETKVLNGKTYTKINGQWYEQ